MKYLIFVTVLWAFSFSLIDVYLAGSVDADFAVLTRVILAGLIFLPITQIKGIQKELSIGIVGVGVFQIGVTYLCLYRSFAYLTVPEVLLFTVTTPIFVALLDDGMNKRFSPVALMAALLAVFGAGIIRYDGITSGYLTGLLLIQIANFCFALGQVWYKNLVKWYPNEYPQYRFFGYFFLGGLLITIPSFLIFGNTEMLPQTPVQWSVLLWLGLAASGAGLYLWNKGGTLVDAGTLAIMNNALIPAGLLVNILIWNREADLVRLLIGGLIILLSLWVNKKWSERAKFAFN